MADSSVDLIDQPVWERGVPYEVFEWLRRSDPVYWREEPDGPGLWALTLHEDIRNVSKDPARFSSHAAGLSRLDVAEPAMCDVEMRGKKIREGDKVLMWYPSANRDECVFEDPNCFDIRREPNFHLSFGHGEHFCRGASLARLALRVVWEELLESTAEIVPLAPARRLRSNLINAIKEMRVELRPA